MIRRKRRGFQICLDTKKMELTKIDLQSKHTYPLLKEKFSSSKGKLVKLNQKDLNKISRASSTHWLRFGDTCSKPFFDFHKRVHEKTFTKEFKEGLLEVMN
jgi:hypothetical protein